MWRHRQRFRSNQQTAAAAKEWLTKKRAGRGYRQIDRHARLEIAKAFAARNKVVYGQAFDLIRVSADAAVDLGDPVAIDTAVGRNEIVLIEVKATRLSRGDQFRGHFFSISTAELLVAQSLGDLYRFAFVNTAEEVSYEVSLQQIYARTKAIYPTGSIR